MLRSVEVRTEDMLMTIEVKLKDGEGTKAGHGARETDKEAKIVERCAVPTWQM